MLGALAAYASDDSDSDTLPQNPKAIPKPAPAATQKESSLALPSPSQPLSKPKTKRAVFTVAKPTKGSDDDESNESQRP
ncbi:hypothetical protein M422DRAFT_252538, partial [Sphaerobolus stellatus SS14]